MRDSPFSYTLDYWPTCLNYTLRDQTSWDFTLCEGNKGWASAHMTLPFLTVLILGSVGDALLVQGFFEVFEAALLTFLGNYIIFETKPIELETLAGSVLGDFGIQGVIGALAGFLLIRVMCFPSFLPLDIPPITFLRNIDWSQTVCPPSRIDSALGPFCPTECCAQTGMASACSLPYAWSFYRVVTSPLTLVVTGSADLGHALYWWVRVKTWLLWAVMMLLGIFITWVYPKDCLDTPLPSCHNIGIVVTTVLQVVLLALMFFVFYRSLHDDYYVWQCYPLYKRVAVFALAALFVIVINAQGMQPWFPLFLGPTGTWTQTWLFAALWILVFGVAYIILYWRAYVFSFCVRWRALYCTVALFWHWCRTPTNCVLTGVPLTATPTTTRIAAPSRVGELWHGFKVRMASSRAVGAFYS